MTVSRLEASCSAPAKTDFERIYCDIVNQGEGRGLPSFEDFKRNDAIIQKLLLKRPAEKLKIKLPSAHKAMPETSHKTQLSSTLKSPAVVPATPAASMASVLRLKNCQLFANQIKCGHRRFLLKTNQANHRLAKGVLKDSYLMGLPRYRGNRNNDRAIQYYLSDVYSLYIQKMVDIGLGASTMSYRRFYYTFNDLQSKQVSFTERFEKMYGYLKKDKKTMQVKPLLSEHRPDKLSQCDDISKHIIVCDNGSANWVYVN